jgi:hypothetical protein
MERILNLEKALANVGESFFLFIEFKSYFIHEQIL